MTEPWIPLLERGDPEGAWDRFIDRYRRLIFGAIRRSVADADDVMDVFARVCEALRANDFQRLRRCAERTEPGRPISTFIVAVVHNLAIDWLRARDGRPRPGRLGATLPPPRDRIYQLVFVQHRSHLETFEVLRSGGAALTFGGFLRELRATYLAAQDAGRLVESVPVEEDSVPPRETAEALERRDVLETALAALSDEDRLAVQLYVIEGLTADQVARQLGYTGVKTVYNHVYRALAAVRVRLAEAGIGRDDL